MDELNQVVKAALVGSARADLSSLRTYLPEELQEVLNQQDFENSEEELIYLLSLAIPYYKVGMTMPEVSKKINPAKEEIQPYISHVFTGVLRDILLRPVDFLLHLWIEKATKSGNIVLPDLIPELLTHADKNKRHLFYLQKLMGERGRWVAAQHEIWKENNVSAEEAWEIGSLGVRKAAFYVFLSESKDKALGKLDSSWKELSASDRLFFFREIQDVLDEKDLPFLEKIATDRSKQIKKEVRLKLCHTPGHSLNRQLKAFIQSSVKAELKGLWGFQSKHILLKPISPPDELVSGLAIEKESLDKKFTDVEYQFKSVLEFAPVSFLAAHLEMPAQEILKHFLKNKESKKYSESLIKGIIHAKNDVWGNAYFQLMDDKQFSQKQLLEFGKDVLDILEPMTIMRLFSENKLAWISESTIATLSRIQMPWDARFTRSVLSRLKKEYMDSGIVHTLVDQMANLAQWISPEIIPGLDIYFPSPSERKETWRNAIAKLSRNLKLKQRIIEINP